MEPRQSMFFRVFVDGVLTTDLFDAQELAGCIGDPRVDRIDVMLVTHAGPGYNEPRRIMQLIGSDTVQSFIAQTLGE